MRARVFRSSKRVFECQLIDSKRIVSATALATLIKGRKDHIVVGDYVELEKIDADEEKESAIEFQIIKIQERKNEIGRMIPREARKKLTAANCDLLVIMMAVSQPEFKRGLVDRYLVRSHQWQVPAVLIFNKMDQFKDDLDIPFEADRIRSLDVESYELAAKFPDYQKRFLDKGIEELAEVLKGKTAIFLGQSGVGKSKLISALTNGKVDLKTGAIGKLGKGSHTTTWSEMIDCDDFTFIDSPGIRSYSLDDIPEEDLPAFFPDLCDYFGSCKFTNCTHLENAKGCAFNELDPAERSTQLLLSRLDSYLRIDREISQGAYWEKE